MKNEEIIIVIVAVIFGLFILAGAFGGMMGYNYNSGYGMMSGFYGMMSPFGGMWFFGGLFMSLVVIALILFIFWLIKQIQKSEDKKR
jgi:uncharacterized membrane protein